ncbi:hypothetical protein C8P68_104163 [Mucilaginibacter yixingensis]|uniref:Glucosamine inositolphosphorylceramide transferase 1 N-terminal domain-containing protein n=1 Tax=Mucilaginibacter yixingensis TaxID=1295612 RepID=A0A2T5J9E4_9SPHI|nr:hypothetical protein [Mucilaginibacter yixingensis]PTQ96677.1 hypothetical protein C8P68_104163 [Mucilaginibacter yixingensis]
MSFFSSLSRFIRKLFVIDKWNIGYVHQSAKSFIEAGRIIGTVHWLKETKADYAADPFATVINNKLCLYYEELSFWTGKGKIMVTDGFSLAKKRLVKGLPNGKIHLSFPCLFNHAGVTYCVPETADANEVALYRIDNTNSENFIKERVLIEGAAFVDSSLLFYKNKYWLFTSKAGHNNQLYIYYADSLDAPFTAHAKNPISVHKYIGRAAGCLFVVGEQLYRPSQNPEKNYGGSVVISEVVDLDEKCFRFETVIEVTPELHYPRGLHTINFTGDLMIIDGKRSVFSLLNPFKKLAKKLQTQRS